MNLIFDDSTSLQIQKVEQNGEYLRILTIEETPAKLREIFEDPVKTKKMIPEENGHRGEAIEGYTTFYRTEEYVGKIYGVVMYRPDQTPEVQVEVQKAAIVVAQIQAQSLTDEQAVQVKAIYPVYDPNGVSYAKDFKATYNGELYKCLQAHTSQADWTPENAPSLWAKVLAGQEGTGVGEWEQPDSANPYMTGDQVTHNGKTWESLVDNNIWEPGAQGTESLWKVVDE